MKELYLHVGHGKTGSSFIQHNLVLNKKELHANGFFYPQVVSSNESNEFFFSSTQLTKIIEAFNDIKYNKNQKKII